MTRFNNAAGEKCQIIGTFEMEDNWFCNIKNLETHIIHHDVPYIKVKKYVEKNDKRRKSN